MRLILLALLVLCSACATTWTQVGVERVGPVEAEIWRNNKTRTCERRVYMTVMYVTTVECPKNDDKTRTTKQVCSNSLCCATGDSNLHETATTHECSRGQRSNTDGIR